VIDEGEAHEQLRGVAARVLVGPLAGITERFIAGFDQLRDTRNAISLTYENKVLRASREMASLYALVTNATSDPTVKVPTG